MLLAVGFVSALAASACGAGDSSHTDDSELVGTIERRLSPPIAVPTTPILTRKIGDVLAQVTANAYTSKREPLKDGCSLERFQDTRTKRLVGERELCKNSEVVRSLNDDGTTREEHADLDRDGKVDRYTGHDGTVTQYTDANFDGKIDSIVEDVSRLSDFSLEGYGVRNLPASCFAFRVREDRDRDGKFEIEKLVARGAIKP